LPVIVLLFIPLLVYVASSLTIPRNSVSSPADFFMAFRRVSAVPFSNSSVSSSWQVATAYPFLAWAVSGTVLVPLLNSVFWGLGILLFSLALPRIRGLFGSDVSLHSYLGDTYHSRAIQMVTSTMTIIGMLGIALGEITWGSQAVSVAVHGHLTTYVIMGVMVGFVLIYVGIGGQVSSIRTDQLQLVFGYIGCLSLLAVLFVRMVRFHVHVSTLTRWSALCAVVYCLAIVFARRGRILVRTDELNRFDRTTTSVSNILIFAAFASVILVALFFLPHTSPRSVLHIKGFGQTGLWAMILLPLGFQFVDMTNWQRLLGLQGNRDEELLAARKGLAHYAIESPFTWIIFLMMGAAAVDSFPSLATSGNVLADLPRQLIYSGNALDYWSAILFLVGIVAIMLSTVDSVLVAAMFAFVRDTLPAFGVRPLDWFATGREAERPLRWARFFGAGLLVVGVGSYVLIDSHGHAGDSFIGALFAFYTAQLSMLPLVLGAIFLKDVPRGPAVLPGLIISGLSGIALGLYAAFVKPEMQWWPVPACLGIAFSAYGVAVIINSIAGRRV
jgi:Na+/proline symporter